MTAGLAHSLEFRLQAGNGSLEAFNHESLLLHHAEQSGLASLLASVGFLLWYLLPGRLLKRSVGRSQSTWLPSEVLLRQFHFHAIVPIVVVIQLRGITVFSRIDVSKGDLSHVGSVSELCEEVEGLLL